MPSSSYPLHKQIWFFAVFPVVLAQLCVRQLGVLGRASCLQDTRGRFISKALSCTVFADAATLSDYLLERSRVVHQGQMPTGTGSWGESHTNIYTHAHTHKYSHAHMEPHADTRFAKATFTYHYLLVVASAHAASIASPNSNQLFVHSSLVSAYIQV